MWTLTADYGWPFVNDVKFKKYIYLHSTKYVFKASFYTQQLYIYEAWRNWLLYLLNFKEMMYLLIFKEINSFNEHIVIHKKYNHSRQLYSFKELYSFLGTYQFLLFKEIIFIEGKVLYLMKLYSFKFKGICHSKKLYSFNNVAFADILKIFIQQVSPATLY